MKAAINGVEVEGTPKEIAEFYTLVSGLNAKVDVKIDPNAFFGAGAACIDPSKWHRAIPT